MLEDADIRTRWVNAQVTQLMQQNCNLKPSLLIIDILSGIPQSSGSAQILLRNTDIGHGEDFAQAI